MKIIWLDSAINDLIEIRSYISKQNPIAANMVSERLLNIVNILKENPKLGRPGKIPGVRELIVPGLKYKIPYRIDKNEIEIVRVYHTSRMDY